MKNKKLNYRFFYYIFLTHIIILFILFFLYFYKHFDLKQNQSLDYYANFNDLKQHTTKNKDWKIITKHRKHSDTLITAIHGGSIEPGTTELARRISNIGQYNFYSFEGLRSDNNAQLHITSTVFDEPQLLDMLNHSSKTVSIHGYAGDEPIVYVGGQDKKLVQTLRHSLTDHGFTVQKTPKGIEALSNNNIINRDKKDTGVQLELTTRQRALFFKHNNLDKNNRRSPKNYTRTFYRFAEAVDQGIKKAQ